MDRQFRINEKGQEIVDSLKSTLDAGLNLYDAQTNTQHVAMSDWWFSCPGGASEPNDGVCYVRARVNDRWTLTLFSRRGLHPDAEAIARWGARQLELYLPRRSADDPSYTPMGGGGGSSGSAEAGIPVWWARRARGN